MGKAADEEIAYVHALWMERFGEPPAIIAEPELMRRVMMRVLSRPDAQKPRTERSGALEEAMEV